MVIVYGCSGGGGDGASSASYPIANNTFIKYKGGEILIYNASVKSSECLDCALTDVTGTETTYVYIYYPDSPVEYYKIITELVLNDTIVSTNNYYFYDERGNLKHYLTSNYNYPTNPQNSDEGSLKVPNTITIGHSWKNDPLAIIYDDRHFEGDMTYTLIGKETINVPFGSVETFILTYSGTFAETGTSPSSTPDNIEVTGTVWVHPDIGKIKTSESIKGSGINFHPSYLHKNELTDINWDASNQ
jgi:hypothetical protein